MLILNVTLKITDTRRCFIDITRYSVDLKTIIYHHLISVLYYK